MRIVTRLTHQRSNNARNAIHGAKEPLEHGTLLERLGHGDDQISARKDTGGAQARDGAPDDEGGAVRRDAADEGAELEDRDGDEIDPFDGEEGVQFAEDELETGGGKEVGW